MNFKIIYISFFIFTLSLDAQNIQDEQMLFKYLEKFETDYKKDKLARILITPVIHTENTALTLAGYGELNSSVSADFARSYAEGEKKILSYSEGGKLVKLIFIYENRGFTDMDQWVCKLHADSAVLVFPIDSKSRVYIKIPNDSFKIINKYLIENIEAAGQNQ